MLTSQNRSILLKTLKGEPTERPPFWFMRQAGRVLPSYRELKEKHSFWELMKDPDLAAKVTLLPVNDLNVDAAILFSDILVIPHAMGMGLEFTDQGPMFDNPLAFYDNPTNAIAPKPERLDHIYATIDRIVANKPAGIPLIGFCGAPFTVLCYMLQGLGRRADFPDAVRFIYQRKNTTKLLIDAIAELSVEYALNQVKHGVDVFQLFDTHAGLIPFSLYKELFLPAVNRIAMALREKNIPFIFFPKGIGAGISEITPEQCDFLSIDWQTPLPLARKLTDRNIGLQGNMDPRLLFADEDTIARNLESFIPFARENNDWIFNLGHGFLPDTPYSSAKFLSRSFRNLNWQVT